MYGGLIGFLVGMVKISAIAGSDTVQCDPFEGDWQLTFRPEHAALTSSIVQSARGLFLMASSRFTRWFMPLLYQPVEFRQALQRQTHHSDG